MFKTSLKNAPIKFGRRTLLKEAFWVFKKLLPAEKVVKVRDSYGTIALDLGKYYLVAKRRTYADIVSVHKKLWDMSLKRKGFILIYLQESGFFYRFNPAEIKETSINERGGIQMQNFSIKNGINLMNFKSQKQRKEWVVKKNKDYLKKVSPKKGSFEEYKEFLV